MKTCPFCSSEVPDDAVICRYCGSQLGEAPGFSAGARPESQVLTLVMGILGLFCCPFGIVALVLWLGHRGRVKRGEVRSDGAATAGMVLGLVGIGWQMLFLIAGIAVYRMPAFREALVGESLRSIHQAQVKYKAKNGEYSADLEKLRPFGAEPGIETAKWFSYRLELTAAGDEWSLKAVPEDPSKYRYFYIDQTGVLRQSKSADVGPESPPYLPPKSFGDKG